MSNTVQVGDWVTHVTGRALVIAVTEYGIVVQFEDSPDTTYLSLDDPSLISYSHYISLPDLLREYTEREKP